MITYSDLHTHTVHSHGTGTVEQNVLAAINQKLESIAITDHSVRHAFYAVRDVEKYLGDIERCKSKYKDIIQVQSGLELNLISLDGELDLPRGYENAFDILLFGFHKLVRFKGAASSLHFLLPKSADSKAIERNTRAYIAAIRQNPIKVITHIGYGLPVDKLAVAKAAAEKGVLLEINNKHPEFSVSELTQCAQSGVQFVLDSDAHSPESVGHMENAIIKAAEAALPISSLYNAKEDFPK